ncbi:hypothetical protein H0H93_001173, partial [Arthromyces matolae]
ATLSTSIKSRQRVRHFLNLTQCSFASSASSPSSLSPSLQPSSLRTSSLEAWGRSIHRHPRTRLHRSPRPLLDHPRLQLPHLAIMITARRIKVVALVPSSAVSPFNPRTKLPSPSSLSPSASNCPTLPFPLD